jgi:3-phenylpropionate/cinnamic acid dioxygenase small subunit
MTGTAARDRQREIEQFLYHEAWLLEQRRFDEWLELLTDDVVYYLPNHQEMSRIEDDAMIAYDDYQAMRMRVARLGDLLNPARQPAPRTKYFVTNVALLAEDADVEVRSSVLLYIVRDRSVRHHPISCEYRLRPTASGLKIAYKKVYLLENGTPLATLPLI